MYIIGLPLGVFIILYKRRRFLFETPASVGYDDVVETNRSNYGFLYEVWTRCPLLKHCASLFSWAQ